MGTLICLMFLGGESMLLLGVENEQVPIRAALRRFGDVIPSVRAGGSGMRGDGAAGAAVCRDTDNRQQHAGARWAGTDSGAALRRRGSDGQGAGCVN